MSSQKPILIIAGPTAVGKTDASILLAQEQGAEIVSADSMQIYRGMDIGTAKPTPEQRKQSRLRPPPARRRWVDCAAPLLMRKS